MKGDEAIGKLRHSIHKDQEVFVDDLYDEPRRLMELGKRAVEAKDWKHEMFERWEALHCKCPDHVEEWMVNEAVQAYASGLASAEMSDGRVRQNPQTMLAERDALITRLEKEADERDAKIAEKSVYQNGTRANEFYRLLLAGKRTFDEELYFIHAELRRWYAAGLASADAKIAELERELAVTKALAGVPIPDVTVGSAASTEGLAPPACSECGNFHLNGGTCLETVPCERFENSAIALARARRPSGWRVVIRSYQSGGGRNWMAELVAPNGKEKQPIGPYGHTAEEAQSWPIVRLLIAALGATVEVAGKEQQ